MDASAGSPRPADLPPFTGVAPGGSDHDRPDAPPYGVLPLLRNSPGRSALVMGCAALLLSVFPGIGLFVAVTAVVLGVRGVRRARRGEATNGRSARVGLTLGVLATVVASAMTVFVLVFLDEVRDYRSCVDDATTSSERSACRDELSERIDDRLGR